VWVKHSPIIFQVLIKATGWIENHRFVKRKDRCRVIEKKLSACEFSHRWLTSLIGLVDPRNISSATTDVIARGISGCLIRCIRDIIKSND
jgi:hypothetical protein